MKLLSRATIGPLDVTVMPLPLLSDYRDHGVVVRGEGGFFAKHIVRGGYVPAIVRAARAIATEWATAHGTLPESTINLLIETINGAIGDAEAT